MRQIMINELTREEVGRVRGFLDNHCRVGGVSGLYWLALPADLLAEAQIGHEGCGPFALAIELGDDFVTFELLVRSASNLHCSCTAYVTTRQREYLLSWLDRLLAEQAICA